MISSSFWGGFGWIDTIPPSRFVDLCVLATGLSLIVLLAYLGLKKDARRFTWLLIISVGWMLSLATYALVTHHEYRNLHGRYLIGLYLSLLAVFFSAPALIRPLDRGLITRPGLLLTIAGAVHTYCLWFILGRYF